MTHFSWLLIKGRGKNERRCRGREREKEREGGAVESAPTFFRSRSPLSYSLPPPNSSVIFLFFIFSPPSSSQIKIRVVNVPWWLNILQPRRRRCQNIPIFSLFAIALVKQKMMINQRARFTGCDSAVRNKLLWWQSSTQTMLNHR